MVHEVLLSPPPPPLLLLLLGALPKPLLLMLLTLFCCPWDRPWFCCCWEKWAREAVRREVRVLALLLLVVPELKEEKLLLW